MASITDRLITLEGQMRKALANMSTFQGQPANATFSVPHNDSWIFEDNVDATHSANLRYIISKNVTRVVSARLSIFMAPYRTYNNFSATTTGGQSVSHSHGSAFHGHTLPIDAGPFSNAAGQNAAGGNLVSGFGPTTAPVNGTTPGSTGGASVDHTHGISVTSTLGVTEGTVATGVTISFDGADATVALGGPFNADVIELDVRQFIVVTQGVKHTIAMKPTGNGRIEAHLRLGVYVSASQIL